MKKILVLMLALLFCTAAFAETEPETDAIQDSELMGYIGGTFSDLMVRLGEPADEVQAFKEGRWQKYNFDDGYTVYLQDYAIVVRANNDDYTGYGWEPDTVFYIGLSDTDEYTLNGYSIGDYFPDVDSSLRADGWIEMEEYMINSTISYEKTVDDVKYMLEIIYSDLDFEDDYNTIRYIGIQGIRIGNAE